MKWIDGLKEFNKTKKYKNSIQKQLKLTSDYIPFGQYFRHAFLNLKSPYLHN